MPYPPQERRDEQDRLHKVMLQARDDWDKASAELAQVFRMSRAAAPHGPQTLKRHLHAARATRTREAVMPECRRILGRAPGGRKRKFGYRASLRS
jgi:hypothetical protein